MRGVTGLGQRGGGPNSDPRRSGQGYLSHENCESPRTKEGMRIAKAKGRLRGKQPKLNPRQEAHLVALLKSGEYSTAELGDLFGVARSTVYRAIGREAARQRAERSDRSVIATIR